MAGPETSREGNHAMMGTQLSLNFDAPPPPFIPANDLKPVRQLAPVTIASGEKGKARDIIAAIRTLKAVEEDHRTATQDEKQLLSRFSGFGPVALSLFPDPVTGRYKDDGWRALGGDLKALLTPEEYDSTNRTELRWSVRYHCTRSLAFAARRSTRANVWSNSSPCK
jgi:hypothetical protein